MRGLALVLWLAGALLSGCSGSTSTANRNSAAAKPSITRTPATPPTEVSRSSPAIATSGESAASPAYVVITSISQPYTGRSTVSLVAENGHIAASLTVSDRSPGLPSCYSWVYTSLPCVSTSNDRVYVLDGDSTLRFMAADGSTGTAGRLPGTATAAVGFAVSPNDERIAISLFDFSVKPEKMRLYVSDLTGGNRKDLAVSSSDYVYPVGWHSGNIVVAVGPPTDYTVQPLGNAHQFDLVDASSGARLAQLGTASCQPFGVLLSSHGTSCISSAGDLEALGWDGSAVRYAGNLAGQGGASALSPDGARIAKGNLDIVDSPATGGNVTHLNVPLVAAAGGWLDDQHLVSAHIGDVSILDLGTGAVIHADAQGIVAARLPGAL